MADRYLLLAVLGPCVGLGFVLGRLGRRALTMGVLAALGALTLVRGHVFADSVRLWEDAAAHEPRSARAHYQRGMTLREAGAPAAAAAAFARAFEVAAHGDGTGRMAANNLADLLTAAGRLGDARALLRQAVARFPVDGRVLGNLAELCARLGDHDEARRLFQETMRRFPDYAPAARHYQQRYGGGR